ncbi:uncharacterized protein LOC124807927 isoform X1 [Hydra vulgaris]|uniref:uncharacterized protein LOC124807927 isoform X1 n=1 Tax=Hydra vulgaris TaxID=6087 RepID=UPI0032EA839B
MVKIMPKKNKQIQSAQTTVVSTSCVTPVSTSSATPGKLNNSYFLMCKLYIQVIKDVLKTITTCKSNPAVLFSRNTDLFGKQLAPNILNSITTLCLIDAQLIKMTSDCLVAVESVLVRQYKKYFSLSITVTLKEETASARLHNIDSEELMGMFSDAKGRCPNATICFISSKLRSKKNRTIDYLDNLKESQLKRHEI